MDHDLDRLRRLTNEEWQIVLRKADRRRGRWSFVIIQEDPDAPRREPSPMMGRTKRRYTISADTRDKHLAMQAGRLARQMEIADMLDHGMMAKDIAAHFGVSAGLISKIRKGLR